MKKHLLLVLALTTFCLSACTDKHEQELKEKEANAVYSLSPSEMINKKISGASSYFIFEFTSTSTCMFYLTDRTQNLHYEFNKASSSSARVNYKQIDNKTAHLDWTIPMIYKSTVNSKYDRYETFSGSTDLEFTSKGKGHTNGSEYGYNGNKYDTPYSFTIE